MTLAERKADLSVRARRRRLLAQHPTLCGLDFVGVNTANNVKFLHLELIPPLPGIVKQPLPDVTPQNFVIFEGENTPQNLIRITAILRETDRIVAALDLPGASTLDNPPLFTIELVDSADVRWLDRVDRLFRRASFSLAARLPEVGVDEAPAFARAIVPPEIDYLAKDYSSFRKLMLDRLSQLLPGGIDTHVAGTEQVLVEILAHAADQLSYYQDAVGTESYLGTARQRVSLRRHARLLDFRMHEGCNARVWIHLSCTSAATLPAGTRLLTKALELPAAIDSAQGSLARQSGSLVFETMHEAALDPALNLMEFDLWGATTLSIPRGATTAALRDNLALAPGQVLIFEEVATPAADHILTPDPQHRHAVRLSAVRHSLDELRGVEVTEIEWTAEDALPFDLTVTERSLTTVIRGNIVLADHGETVSEDVDLPDGARFRQPSLRQPGLTFRAPLDLARSRSARSLARQAPAQALPAVRLVEADRGIEWGVQLDLLGSDRFSRDFVVEVNNQREALLRFGDGAYGRKPSLGLGFVARYRVGCGTAGNVGQDAVGHLILEKSDPLRASIQAVRNPIAASGGTDPQPIDEVRLHAPQAFRRQERGVTAQDLADAALRHPEVVKAAAAIRWTGSWFTVFVVVDRRGAVPVDDAFRTDLLTFLEPFRVAGGDIEIQPPRLVGVDIEIEAVAAPDQLALRVERDLRDALGVRSLPDGSRGFFHPENFTLGQPVYWSRLAARALRIPGLARVEARRFDRIRPGPAGEKRVVERIEIGALEIARLAAPTDRTLESRLAITVTGGR